jgi:multiple sugar transport system permease protein
VVSPVSVSEVHRQVERPAAPRLAVGASVLAAAQAAIAIAVAVLVALGGLDGGTWLWLVLAAAEVACAVVLVTGAYALRQGRDSLLVVGAAIAVVLALIWAVVIWLNSGTSGMIGVPDLGTAPALVGVALVFAALPVTVLAFVHAPSASDMVDTVGPRRGSRYGKRETRAAVLFISPWIIGFLVFTLGPMLWSLYLSFTKYALISPPEFTGFRNYQRMIEDPKVATALANTFIYAVLFVPCAIVVSLGLAMLLNRLSSGAGFFRTVYYLPVMTPGVAVAVLFSLLLNGNYGLINRALALVGIQGPQWLTDPSWIKPSIVLMSLWGLGGAIVIFLAALKSVPRTLYEAAALDGASAWRQFRSVTLPMISGAMFFQVIVLTIAAMQLFDKIFVLFGNPGSQTSASSASLFYVLYLFQQAFQELKMGYASALAWLLFIIIMIITAIQVKVGNRLVYYEGDDRK